MRYEETQYNRLINFFILLFMIFLFFSYTKQWGTKPIPKTPFLIMEGLFISIFALFYKMTVVVDEGLIRISYGIGLIGKKISPEKVLRVEEFKVPWYWGLGIRMTPKGWLFSIKGFKAVLIKYAIKERERTVLIGTSDPQRLKIAIERHFSSRGNRH